MIEDERAVKALLMIMNNHKLQGSEAPAFLKLIQWINMLPSRLRPIKQKKNKKEHANK